MSDFSGDEDVNAVRAALIAHAEAYGLDGHAAALKAGRELEPPAHRTPVIVDTDIGGDADDALAVAVAARSLPQLALVITTDEVGGERARFARHLLDLLGRRDVAVVAGRSLGSDPLYCVDGLVPGDVPAQGGSVVSAVEAVLAASNSAVRWVGMGPLSNLADVLSAHPEWAGRLAVTQMGGAFRYRDPSRAEHNFRLDPDAASAAMGQVEEPQLVISDVTFTSEIEVTAESAVFASLVASGTPAWAQLLGAHLTRWFERHYPGSMQHDGLTLSAALELPFVDFDLSSVEVLPDGRMVESSQGIRAWVATCADYVPFMRWLEAALGTRTVARGA